MGRKCDVPRTCFIIRFGYIWISWARTLPLMTEAEFGSKGRSFPTRLTQETPGLLGTLLCLLVDALNAVEQIVGKERLTPGAEGATPGIGVERIPE